MKVIICGKGGSGKSTISTLFVKALNSQGFKVLLIDADESNVGLHKLMGVSEPVVFMDSLGGKKGFKEKINQAFPRGNTDEIIPPNTKIDDIPKERISEVDGIKMLAVGKIQNAGEGCACPMGMLSRAILSKLVVQENEVVVIDAEAGVEHFGRGLDAGCDLILGVVDPTYESFMLAKKMQEMAEKAEKEILFVLNKVDENIEALMEKHMTSDKIIAKIPQSNEVFMDSLEGNKLSATLPEIDKICALIKERKELIN